MDEFMKALVALRSGAGRTRGKLADVAKGTLANMGNVRERSQEMLDTERARNRKMIDNLPGGMRAYEERRRTADPAEEQRLFGNPYVNAIRALLGKD